MIMQKSSRSDSRLITAKQKKSSITLEEKIERLLLMQKDQFNKLLNQFVVKFKKEFINYRNDFIYN